ncbi:hypothetical protein IP70_16455 [alpha proteobacterium AAP38]|nr:hypothetical protein IP70_16455 [alpha proteobacterium AAP38]
MEVRLTSADENKIFKKEINLLHWLIADGWIYEKASEKNKGENEYKMLVRNGTHKLAVKRNNEGEWFYINILTDGKKGGAGSILNYLREFQGIQDYTKYLRRKVQGSEFHQRLARKAEKAEAEFLLKNDIDRYSNERWLEIYDKAQAKGLPEPEIDRLRFEFQTAKRDHENAVRLLLNPHRKIDKVDLHAVREVWEGLSIPNLSNADYLTWRCIKPETWNRFPGDIRIENNRHNPKGIAVAHRDLDGSLTGFERKGFKRYDGEGPDRKVVSFSVFSGSGQRLTTMAGDRASPKVILMGEAFLDLVSYFQDVGCPAGHLLMSSGGTPGQESMDHFVRVALKFPETQILLTFDNDEPGHRFAKHVRAYLSENGVKENRIKDNFPDADYKDWNDMVRGIRFPHSTTSLLDIQEMDKQELVLFSKHFWKHRNDEEKERIDEYIYK